MQHGGVDAVAGEVSMSRILPIQQIRAAIADAVDDIPHPTKDRQAMGLQRERHGDVPLRYGRIVYFDGGAVGVCGGGVYRIARGDDHDDSLRQLAYVLRLSEVNLDVPVETVTADEFRQAITG